MLKVSVISWNTKELINDCLKSITENKVDFPISIEVVDNASTDGSIQMIKDKYSNVKIIENKNNLGFAKAANQAINKDDYKYNLILNSDTKLKPDCLQTLVDFMENSKESGAVGPLLLNMDGSIQYSGRKFPSFREAALHAFLGIFSPQNKASRRYMMMDWDRKHTKEVDWISGAAICLRKEAVSEAGMFDESYYMYVEDMDLCYRLWQQGWKVFLLPEAKVYHHIGQSSKQQSAKMIKEFQKSIYRFYVKQNQGSYKVYLKYFVAIGLFFRGLLLILTNWLRRNK